MIKLFDLIDNISSEIVILQTSYTVVIENRDYKQLRTIRKNYEHNLFNSPL